MPRHMSFFATKPQILARVKTETRRKGWRAIEVGDVLWAVEKGQGLKKGEKVNKLCQIRVVAHGYEPLNAITKLSVIREGFPAWSPQQFIELYQSINGGPPDQEVHWIRFEYVEGENGDGAA